MAMLMSPATVNFPVMKPVIGSSWPASSASRFSWVIEIVQSASRFSLLTVFGDHAFGAAIELEHRVEAALFADLAADRLGALLEIHGIVPLRGVDQAAY
jgi:hypothetical protein